MIRVRLLGSVAVFVEDRPVELPEGRPRELLAWLAAHPGAHPRSTLAPTFWPDISDSGARASLRTALWGLRRALGSSADTVLIASRDTIELGGPDLEVDLRQLRDLVRVGALRDASEVATGEILEGIVSEWADGVRDDHRRELVELLGGVAAEAEAAGDLRGAIEATRRQLKVEPLSEPVHRDLLRRLDANGDGATAALEHGEFRRRLWETLRLVPAAETTAIANRLAAHPRPDTGPGSALPERLAVAEQRPFVGRADTLAQLHRLWEEIDDRGPPTLCLITGEPGIGKTRLAARFAAGLAEEGVVVRFGSAAEDALVPGEPFREALGLSPAAAVHELVDGVHRRLDDITTSSPCVLVIDDLQWADTASLGLLRRVLLHRFPRRLAVVATQRDTDEGSSAVAISIGELSRDSRVERIELSGLSRHETLVLLRGDAPEPTPETVADAVHSRTDGNPLFITELARFLDRGADVPDPSTAIPDSVRELVAIRVARLTSAAAGVLAAAAVIGARVERALLAEVVDPAVDLIDALEELLATGMLVETDRGTLSFHHALVREAVYVASSHARRTDLHARVVDILEARARPERHVHDLAHHACAAVPVVAPADALAAVDRSVDAAFEEHCFDQAVITLSRALVVADAESRPALSVRRAVAYQRLTHQLLDPGPG